MNAIRRSRGNALRFSGPVALAAVVGAVFWVNAGQLDPPPGAINPTGPTTINGQGIVLPYTISDSGSYILTSNIEAPSSHTGHGIVIDASDVTLDLNGFALTLTGGEGGINGIMVYGSHSNIAIKNGTVRAWNEVGVEAFSAGNSRFEDLRLSNNTVAGLRLNEGSTVTGCTASKNGIGMVVDGCTVTGCAFDLNTGIGIVASGGSVVTDCVARANGQGGFSADGGTLISGCAASLNTGHGFVLSGIATITDSTAMLNTGDGIHLVLDGIVFNCTARVNGGNGIFAFRGATVSGCTVDGNTGDGIQVSDQCRVVGNHCVQNGRDEGDGAGIHTTSDFNYIEGNVVIGNDRGIDVDSTGSFIFKNSAMANTTNYDIAAINAFGPIVNIGGVGDISGTANADHPWANFEE
ncbi:MAG: right-handed parallel beta-helix repeat-containing protein [Phycisphaerales bacterium]|nr:MAG: right-handed parallel beta-helix repeat-containing protein [Phycisphaerales bacterium]